MTLDAKGYAE